MTTIAEARPSATKRSIPRSILALVLFLAISFAVAAIGSVATIQNVDGWYAGADLAPWNPPNWVFGPVWTVLYTVMSVAAWLVWREPASPQRSRALGVYVIQLVLNALWTPVFFGLFNIFGPLILWLALLIIVALDVLVLATMVQFWKVRRLAAVLLIPYWAWVLYATTLNAYISLGVRF